MTKLEKIQEVIFQLCPELVEKTHVENVVK